MATPVVEFQAGGIKNRFFFLNICFQIKVVYLCFRLLQLAYGSCNGQTKKNQEKKITYLGPKLCGNSSFALNRTISEP